MDEARAVDILLVEDSDADAEMTLRALQRGKVANTVRRVRDGVEALDFVYGEGPFAGQQVCLPKLIMLDLKMPRLGGIDVLRRLKSTDVTMGVPVVMLTSSAEEKDVIESYGLGVNSYLVKPVAVSSFMEMIVATGMYWIVRNRHAS